MRDRTRHAARTDYERVFCELNGMRGRGLDGAIARLNIKMLQAFVEQIEAERDLGTSGGDFLNGMVVVLANLLGASLKYTMAQGDQIAALPVVLDALREELAGRLDKPIKAPMFCAGFHRKAAARGGVSTVRASINPTT
jgi:hypothetical protein